MSLLSVFSIAFETDAKQAANDVEDLDDALENTERSASNIVKAFDDATASTSELIAQMKVLGFSNSEITDSLVSLGSGYEESINAVQDFDQELKEQEKQSKKTNESNDSLINSLFKMAAAYVSVSTIINGVLSAATNIDTLGKLSQTIGLNIVELDAWGAAAERNGGSAEALRGIVESLQTSLQDISITGGGEIVNTLAMIGVQATKTNGEIKSAFEILPEIAESFSRMSTEQSFAFGKRLGLDQGTILTLQQSRHEIDQLVERQKNLGGVTKEGYETAAKFNDQWDDTKRVFNSLWLDGNSTILPFLEKLLKGLELLGTWTRDNKNDIGEKFARFGGPIATINSAIAILYEDILAWSNGSQSAIGDLIKKFDDFKENVKNISIGIFDSLTEEWGDFVEFFDSSVKDIADFLENFFSSGVKVNGEFIGKGLTDFSVSSAAANTERAQSIVSSYSATNLNHGGSAVNQRTQTNNITVGGSTINANGMSKEQAVSAFSAGFKENVEMAIGQITDGIVA